MTIIHVTAGIQETCGVSQYVVNTARAQQALGHDVTIVTAMTCGYPVADLKVTLAENPVVALSSMLGTRMPGAIVHIHSMWNTYVHRAATWCRHAGVPYVISPHGSATPWAMRYKWWKKFPAWWLYQRADFCGAAAFHATVPEEEGDVRRLGFRQPVVVAPLGATVVESDVAEPDCCCPWRDIVFLSRIHPKKNVGALLRAWAMLTATKNKVRISSHKPRLVVAGSDDVGHQEELVALAKELGLRVIDFSRDLEFGKKQIHGGGEVPVETFQMRLADCDADVVFTGPVYSRAKDWMFAHAWVSVLPSHSENFGGVVVESLAQGTPVIASKGTPWDVLETAGCGWWIEAKAENLAATIQKVLDLSCDERRELSQRAKELVENQYSWQSSAKLVVGFYETLV